MRLGLRIGIGIALVGLVGAGACRMLPERFAVNAPMLTQMLGIGGGPPPPEQHARLVGPPGYAVALFAEVPNARLLRFTRGGDLLVSSPRTDSVWRLPPDRDGDGRSDAPAPLALELDRPHGIDLHEGHLYVGEGTRIQRVPFDEQAGRVTGAAELLVDGLPDGGNHWTRTVAVGPDGKLYVTVGSSCNVCIEQDERRAAMLRYERDGTGYQLFATGLRNAVDFDWQPGTGALYATDNGRDTLGNDFPPCELDLVVEGGFYGWPYRNGDNVPDPDFGDRAPALEARAIPPAHAFRAHNAPLGIHFVDEPTAPPEWRGVALVALHGSWNRTEKDGYKVVSLHWHEDGSIEERDFMTGFEIDEDVIGRPVDAAVGPDGAFYVSDDHAGVVWRVARTNGGTARPAAAQPRNEAPREQTAVPIDAGLAARGAALFEQHDCASCHDPARAEEGIVARPLEGLAGRYDATALARFLRAPTPPMPRPELDDDERAALAAHLLARHGRAVEQP